MDEQKPTSNRYGHPASLRNGSTTILQTRNILPHSRAVDESVRTAVYIVMEASMSPSGLQSELVHLQGIVSSAPISMLRI